MNRLSVYSVGFITNIIDSENTNCFLTTLSRKQKSLNIIKILAFLFL